MARESPLCASFFFAYYFEAPDTDAGYLTIIPRGRVGYEIISNKREWNNCFIKNAHKILEQTGKDKGLPLFTCHTSIKTVNARTDSPGLRE